MNLIQNDSNSNEGPDNSKSNNFMGKRSSIQWLDTLNKKKASPLKKNKIQYHLYTGYIII